jgi:CRISPR-associated protein Cas2
MICLLVYDITHDGTRSKVSDACLDYGLKRIQFSAFLGDLSRTHQEELFRKVRKQLGRKPGKIQLFPMCERDLRQRLEVIQEPKERKPGAKVTATTEPRPTVRQIAAVASPPELQP